MSHDETEREMRDLKWQDEKAEAGRDVSFDRLEAIIRDRTPGPYKSHVSDSYGGWWHVEAPEHEDLKSPDGSQHPLARSMRSCDAEFLSVMGTLADLLLDVVNASNRFLLAYSDGGYSSDLVAYLADALDALRAAQEKL